MYIVAHVTKTLSGKSYTIPADENGIVPLYAELCNACDQLVWAESKRPTVHSDTWSTKYQIYCLVPQGVDASIEKARKRAEPVAEDPVPHKIYKELLEQHRATLDKALDKIRWLEKTVQRINQGGS